MISEARFLSQIIPPFQHVSQLIVYACQYDVNSYDMSLFTSVDICFPEKLKNSVVKRQAEYLAGRIVARQCLGDLNLQSYQVLSDSHRCPVWPVGVKGAISHTNDIAACVVTTSREVQGVGIDVECIVSSETMVEIKDKIVDDTEWQMISEYHSGQPENFFTTVFSAKESIFKALYPTVKEFFDFSAAKLKSIDLSGSALCFELSEFLSPEYPAGSMLFTSFELKDDTVYTLCIT